MYKKHLITYFDILGFKEIIDNSPAKKVKEILTLFREESKPAEIGKHKADMEFINFSDTNIRAYCLETKQNLKHPDGKLYIETLIVAHIQYRLLFEGVLIRGSMTVGDLYANDGMWFGPGLVRGHFLENNIAVFPRIVIDPAVIQCFKETDLLSADHHDLATDTEFLLETVRKDIDGAYYLDYLRAMSTEFDEEGGYGSFLNDHKELIEKRCSKYSELNSISIKYGWLAEYHNSTIRTFDKEVDGWQTDDLLVDIDNIPFRHDLPDMSNE